LKGISLSGLINGLRKLDATKFGMKLKKKVAKLKSLLSNKESGHREKAIA
jgi:hypothetical protein